MMTLTTSDFIALLTLMLWPAVPLFWVPVHCQPRFFKRLGFITYTLPLVTWLPAVYIVNLYRLFLLEFTVSFPLVVNIAGAMSLILGIALQLWTLMLLKLPVIMGRPEVLSSVRSELIHACKRRRRTIRFAVFERSLCNPGVNSSRMDIAG